MAPENIPSSKDIIRAGKLEIVTPTSESNSPAPEAQSVHNLKSRVQSFIQSLREESNDTAAQKHLDSIITHVAQKYNVSASDIRGLLGEESKNIIRDKPDIDLTPELQAKILADILSALHAALETKDNSTLANLEHVFDNFLQDTELDVEHIPEVELAVKQEQQRVAVLLGGISAAALDAVVVTVAKKIHVDEQQVRILIQSLSKDIIREHSESGLSLQMRLAALRRIREALENIAGDEVVRALRSTSIDDLIESVHVTDEQRQQWESMRKLDIPKNARVQLISVSGAHDFETPAEHPYVQKMLTEALGHDVGSISIDNRGAKEDILRSMTAALSEGDYDYRLLYFSSHGITPSAWGVAEEGAVDDEFLVLSGDPNIISHALNRADTLPFEIVRYADGRTPSVSEKTSTGILDTVEQGTVLKVDGEEVTVHRTESIQVFLKTYLITKERALTGLSVREITQCIRNATTHQSELHDGVPPEEHLQILFDNCYAGSAVGEGLMENPNVQAVLASSAASEVSRMENGTNIGNFLHALFENTVTESKDAPSVRIGAGYIHADMELNAKPFERQNPKAEVRNEHGEIIKVSSVSHEPPLRFRDLPAPLGEAQLA